MKMVLLGALICLAGCVQEEHYVRPYGHWNTDPSLYSLTHGDHQPKPWCGPYALVRCADPGIDVSNVHGPVFKVPHVGSMHQTPTWPSFTVQVEIDRY